jgi:hypothetical protein
MDATMPPAVRDDRFDENLFARLGFCHQPMMITEDIGLVFSTLSIYSIDILQISAKPQHAPDPPGHCHRTRLCDSSWRPI